MSGHSHSKTIRRIKELTDKKRGQIFSKLSRQISVAAREGGEDPAANPKLRIAIEKARFFNLPKENIQRAIDRGVGKLPGIKLEQVTFEAYGPGGIALIIEGITDNKKRAFSEVKQILNQNNGKLVGEGSVRWLFERKGCITLRLIAPQLPTVHTQQGAERPVCLIAKQLQGAKRLVCITNQYEYTNKEELELKAIEAGAEDISWHNDALDIYTKAEDLEKVKKNLENQGIKIESASLDWVAKEHIEVGEKEKEACQKLFESLDESDSVQEIYSNLKV